MAKTPEYLDDDFEPRKATIASLSSILSKHGVDLPASRQRKEFYVDLFLTEIAQKSDSILQEMENIKPSGEGIVYVQPKSKIPVKPSRVLTENNKLSEEVQKPKDIKISQEDCIFY